MKRHVLIGLVAMIAIGANAQDDMYFVPTKKNIDAEIKKEKRYVVEEEYQAPSRDVDEYNRMAKSGFVLVDSAGNEIVAFDGRTGADDTVYVAAEDEDDYKYTRRMSRFDDYEWRDTYWAGYRDGRASSWYGWHGWHSWYGWYDPWYYDSWYWSPSWTYWSAWYDPWYWGYPYHHHLSWGWGCHWTPIYNGGTRYYTNASGTRNHGRGNATLNRFTDRNGNRTYNPSRSAATRSYGDRSTVSGNRSNAGSNRSTVNSSRYNNNNDRKVSSTPSSDRNSFGGGSRSTIGGGTRSSGSFGGGSIGGGSRGGGGGSFGGGSRGGGGRR